MLSRVFWVFLAGAALVAGIIIQDGDGFMSLVRESEVAERADRRIDRTVDRSIDRAVDRSVESAVEGGLANMKVVGADGGEIAVPADARRALGDAVGRLVEAEADRAVLRFRDASAEEIRLADQRRNEARAEVDRLKAQIETQRNLQESERAVVREQIRSNVRETVRDAVRN